MTQTPSLDRGFFFSGSRVVALCLHEFNEGHSIVGNNAKPIAFRQITAAEFARLSSSMQVTLLTIRRAQLSSRRAIAATEERKRRRGDT